MKSFGEKQLLRGCVERRCCGSRAVPAQAGGGPWLLAGSRGPAAQTPALRTPTPCSCRRKSGYVPREGLSAASVRNEIFERFEDKTIPRVLPGLAEDTQTPAPPLAPVLHHATGSCSAAAPAPRAGALIPPAGLHCARTVSLLISVGSRRRSSAPNLDAAGAGCHWAV